MLQRDPGGLLPGLLASPRFWQCDVILGFGDGDESLPCAISDIGESTSALEK